jgi:putative methionine-R-sulfoxide reductase with GAF domain
MREGRSSHGFTKSNNLAECFMSNETRSDPDRSANRMQQVIDQQAAEIEALRAQLVDDRFVQELKHSLIHAAAAGAIVAPLTHSRLLETVVQTSMHVVSAEAAALFLVDDDAQELSFEVALGPHAAAVRHLRVPLGHGIAGLVAMTGQPIIVADAERDPRQASDIAEAAGYTPRSILCVPLLRNDRVIGVLEMLDKHGSPSFAPADMEMSALFAEQAAVAIEQSLTIRNTTGLLAASLAQLVGSGDDHGLAEQVEGFARRVENTPLYQRALDLAILVREVAGSGDAELRLCETILRGFAEYLRSHSASSIPGMEPWT